jgi:hypothetical protein
MLCSSPKQSTESNQYNLQSPPFLVADKRFLEDMLPICQHNQYRDKQHLDMGK